MFENNEIYEENLFALSPYLPAAVLKELSVGIGFEAKIDKDPKTGEVVNLSVFGESIYSDSVFQYVEEQLASFKQNPFTLKFDSRLGNAKNLEDAINRDPWGATEGQFIASSMAQAVSDFEQDMVSRSLRPDFMVCMGLGLGTYIEDLVKSFDFGELIVSEVALDFLYASMHVVDWSAIVRCLEKTDRKLKFLFHSNEDFLKKGLVELMKNSVNGAIEGSYIYVHHRYGAVGKAVNLLPEVFNLLIQHNGWIGDELLHLRNSIDNYIFNSSSLLVHQPVDFQIDLPVVIVGSGPSLSESMDILRQIQNNVCLVSSGSALKPLLENGIRPRFHCELENGDLPVASLAEVARDYQIGDIVLLASMTTTRKLNSYVEGPIGDELEDFTIKEEGRNKLFDEVIYFSREGSMVSRLIEDQVKVLPNSGGTATLSALAFFLYQKPKQIYLVGLDFGASVTGQHHVEGTIYEANPQKYYAGSGGDRQKVVVRGNRGDKVESNNLWLFMRNCVEVALASCDHKAKVFNVGSGAYIDGAQPCEASDLSRLLDPSKDSRVTQKKILEYYRKSLISGLSFEPSLDALYKVTKSFSLEVLQARSFLGNYSHADEMIRFFSTLFLKFDDLEAKNNSANIFFQTVRAQIGYVSMVIRFFDMRLDEADKPEVIRKIILKALDGLNVVLAHMQVELYSSLLKLKASKGDFQNSSLDQQSLGDDPLVLFFKDINSKVVSALEIYERSSFDSAIRKYISMICHRKVNYMYQQKLDYFYFRKEMDLLNTRYPELLRMVNLISKIEKDLQA